MDAKERIERHMDNHGGWKTEDRDRFFSFLTDKDIDEIAEHLNSGPIDYGFIESVSREAEKVRSAGYDPVQILRDFRQSASEKENWDTLQRVAKMRKQGVDVEGEIDKALDRRV